MCPRCHAKAEHINMRVKYCRGCHQYHHRDVMAGENMAAVAKALATGQDHPEYLARPARDGDSSSDNETKKPKKPPDRMRRIGGAEEAATSSYSKWRRDPFA